LVARFVQGINPNSTAQTVVQQVMIAATDAPPQASEYPRLLWVDGGDR